MARLGFRPSLVAAIALMVFWVVAYRQLSPMSAELFRPSWSGLHALGLYLVGEYESAARAYRAGQRAALRVDYADDTSGYEALLVGDLVEAERRAQTTLMLVPTATEPLVTLGEIAIERGQFLEASGYLGRAVERRPDHVDALYLAAVALGRIGIGEDGRAVDLLNRAFRHGSIGTRSTTLFRIMEATGELARRAPRDRPLCLLAHFHRYLRIFDPSHSPLAMRYAIEAIAANDRPADAYLTLGVLHDKLGEHTQALHALQNAAEIDPRHAEASRWAAVEASDRSDLLLELRMIRAAFDAAPRDPFYLRHLERVVMTKLGDPHLMATLMQHAIDLDPDNIAAHERLARAAAFLGDIGRSAAHARLAADLWHRLPSTVERRINGR